MKEGTAPQSYCGQMADGKDFSPRHCDALGRPYRLALLDQSSLAHTGSLVGL